MKLQTRLPGVLTRSGIVAGTLTVFVQHTSCSLIIMENVDPTARRDLEEFFDRLVPENAPHFEHNDEGPDDMPSHIRMSLRTITQRRRRTRYFPRTLTITRRR